MRRIYKTSTAIVTCLSLIAPQIAVAQDQQNQNGQVVLPKDADQANPGQAKAEKPRGQKPPAQKAEGQNAEGQKAAKPQPKGEKAQADKPAAKPKATPAAAEAEQGGQRQQKPQDQQREAAPKPQGQGKAAAQQAENTDSPAPKPEVTQAADPRAKPPVVAAETPAPKPKDAGARDRAMSQDADSQEAPKQPGAEPEAQSRNGAAQGDAPQKPGRAQSEQAQGQDDDTMSRENLKEALERQRNPNADQADAQQPGQQNGQTPPPRRNPQQAGQQPDAGNRQSPPEGMQANGDRPEAPDAAEVERRLRQQQRQNGDQPQEQRADTRAQSGQQAGKGDQAQPPEIRASQGNGRPNDVARRAAEQIAPPSAAALGAGGDAPQAKRQQMQITRDNARSSDEDFATSVTQGLKERAEDRRRDEAREDDDDDDTLKNVATLLLAGAAGMAVGKMLSNDRQVALNTGDRVVVTLPDGSQQIIRDDNALLYQPGSDVQTETFDDGSTRTTVLRADGSRVVTIRDANMNILRRTLVRADGTESRLIDDTEATPVAVSTLPAPPPVQINRDPLDEAALREALRREASVDRRFSLGQIRDIPQVRALVPPVNVPEVTFDTGSSAITPDQAQQLSTLGKVIVDSVSQNPNEMFMIEGYTDAVGSNAANLALSDRRAESVALALTEYFDVPPENMVVQGYGEQFLLVPSDGDERANRRVAVRRITGLLEQD